MRPKLTFNDSIWNAYELKDIVSFSKGKNVSLDIVTETGFPAMMYGDIYIKYDTFFNKVDYCIPIELSKDSTIIDKNTILMTCTGETAIDIGKSVCYLGETPICIGGDILALKCTDNTNAKFLCLQLNTYDKIKERARLSQGHSVVHLYQHHIEKSKIYKPDIATQTKIATFLNLYYKKIELQKKKVEQLYNLFRCALAFEFHKITDYVSLGSIANLYQPQTITQADFIDNAQYKVFGANGYIGFYDKYNHNKEQVVISCRGEKSSQVNMVEPYSWITGNSMVINLDNSHINKSYVYFALKSQNLKYLITGSGQPQIVRSDLLKHKIPFTNTKTQNDIVSKLSNINNKIFLEQQKLELLEKYKQGLLQKMFI